MTTVIDEISTNDRLTKGSGSDRSEFNYTAQHTAHSSAQLTHTVRIDRSSLERLLWSPVISGSPAAVSGVEIDRSITDRSINQPKTELTKIWKYCTILFSTVVGIRPTVEETFKIFQRPYVQENLTKNFSCWNESSEEMEHWTEKDFSITLRPT